MVVSIFIAIFLGIVQGLTEFLPVSSSGHLILVEHLFGIGGDLLLFNIVLHIATLLAVMFVFRKKIWWLVCHPFCKMNIMLVVSTAITCGMVVLFKDFIDRTFTYKILPFSFLVTAIILFLATMASENTRKRKSNGAHEVSALGGYPVTHKSAVIVGIAQGIAVVPGLSRSGTTISTLLACGVDREKAGEFSFLMSIPVIVAGFLYELMGAGGAGAIDVVPTIFAFVFAMVSGVLAIKFMLGIIARVKLHWFSLYLVILAVVCLFTF